MSQSTTNSLLAVEEKPLDRRQYLRVDQIAGWLSLTIVLCLFIISGFPFPRPLWFFFGLSISVVFISLPIVAGVNLSRLDIYNSLSNLTLAAIILHWSSFVRLTSAGGDHILYIRRINRIIQRGGFTSTDSMYDIAGMIFYSQSIFKILSQVDIYNAVHFQLLYTSFFPLLIYTVTYSISRNHQISVLSAVFSFSFILFIRNSILTQSEGLVLITFFICLIGLFKYIIDNDVRGIILTFFGCISITYTHYLHAAMAVFILSLSIITLRLVQLNFIPLTVRKQPVQWLVIGGLILLPTVTQIMWHPSGFAVEKFVNLFQFSIPNSVVDLLYDGKNGALVQSAGVTETGIGSGGRVLNRIIKFSQLAIAGVFFFIGLLWILYKNKYTAILALCVGTGLPVVLTTITSFDNRVRLYYYLGVIIVILASIGASVLISENIYRWNIDVAGISLELSSYIVLVRAGMVIMILLFTLTGLISPLGNNIDPRAGGNSFSMEETEYAKLKQFDQLTSGDELIPIKIPGLQPRRLGPAGQTSGRETYITTDCRTDNRIWDTGGMCACQSLH